MLTEEQFEALHELRREYFVNIEYHEGMDPATREVIEGVLTAFDLALTCNHDWVRMAADGTRACPYCGAVVLRNSDAPTEQT